MRTQIGFIIALAALAACEPATTPPALETVPAEPAAIEAPLGVPRLEPLWMLSGFSEPEGVAKAPDGSYFISNVAGEAAKFDSKGFISKISPTGEEIILNWANAGHAPKGMAVLDGVLYVTDINRVLKLDANTGAPLGEVKVDGAKFLNDATVWNGAVYVSDSGTTRLIKISGITAETAGESEDWQGLNGILGLDDGSLLLTTMDKGHLVQLQAPDTGRMIATGMKNADGVGLVPGGGYLVSSWSGQIHYVSPEGQVTELLNTAGASIPESILQNDLTVFGDVVIVPNMIPGTVTAYQIKRD